MLCWTVKKDTEIMLLSSLDTWILASASCTSLVKGKVEKVLYLLNLFRQNQSEQNQICKKVYICLVDSSVFISLDIINLII